MRCEICDRDNCARRRQWPDGSKCREYLAARSGSPAPPLPISAPTRPLAEALELRLLIQECPHLKPKEPGDGCGCIGRCTAGKGDLHDGRTSYRNCERCQAGELDTAPVTP